MSKSLASLKKETEKKIATLQRADYSGAGLPAFAPMMKQVTLYRELARLEQSAGNPKEAAAALSDLNDVLDRYMLTVRSYRGAAKLHNPSRRGAEISDQDMTIILDILVNDENSDDGEIVSSLTENTSISKAQAKKLLPLMKEFRTERDFEKMKTVHQAKRVLSALGK